MTEVPYLSAIAIAVSDRFAQSCPPVDNRSLPPTVMVGATFSRFSWTAVGLARSA